MSIEFETKVITASGKVFEELVWASCEGEARDAAMNVIPNDEVIISVEVWRL